MSESRWRRRSQTVIEDVLSRVPTGTPDKEVRLLLRNAYPFGTRKHSPYRIWLSEVRKAIGPRNYPARREVGISLDTSSGDLEVKVVCGWCHGKDCLGCFPLRKRLEQRRATTDWHRWWHWLEQLKEDNDPVTRAAFADWLEEQDWPEEAKRIRRDGK